MTIIENHPFSALSRQIDQLLWASVVLSSCAAIVSILNIGRLSLFVIPVMFLLTAFHNCTILGLTARDRKRPAEALAGTLAVSASKTSIVICWILAGMWFLVVALIIVVSILVMTMGQFEGWQRLVGYIELPLIVAEIGVLMILAAKSSKQRRVSIIEPDHVDWRHVGA